MTQPICKPVVSYPHYRIGERFRKLSTKDKLDFLIQRDGKICGICNQKFDSLEVVNIDHKIPRSKGGRNTADNLQVSHTYCNTWKADKYEPIDQ